MSPRPVHRTRGGLPAVLVPALPMGVSLVLIPLVFPGETPSASGTAIEPTNKRSRSQVNRCMVSF